MITRDYQCVEDWCNRINGHRSDELETFEDKGRKKVVLKSENGFKWQIDGWKVNIYLNLSMSKPFKWHKIGTDSIKRRVWMEDTWWWLRKNFWVVKDTRNGAYCCRTQRDDRSTTKQSRNELVDGWLRTVNKRSAGLGWAANWLLFVADTHDVLKWFIVALQTNKRVLSKQGERGRGSEKHEWTEYCITCGIGNKIGK